MRLRHGGPAFFALQNRDKLPYLANQKQRGFGLEGESKMITRILEKVAAWNKTRAIANELWSLDDRELNDLGIGRGQIAMIASLSAAR